MEAKNKMISGKANKFNAKAQITIFVILGLIIIVAIVGVFMLMNSTSQQEAEAVKNPQSYMEKCVGDSMTKAESIIISGNLFPNMTENYMLYYGEKVKFLCKSLQFYVPCVNQEPTLIESLRKDIEKRVKPDAEKCFADLRAILEDAGYDVVESDFSGKDFILFEKGAIAADMNKSMKITKGENTRFFEKFTARVQSPLYRLLDTTRQIVNYESTLCEFSTMDWMKFNRDISVKKFVASDQSKVYTVEDRISGKSITFAVKTCALPG